MNRVTATVCKAFIEKCPAEKRFQLLRFLPKQEAENIEALAPPFKDPTLGLQSAQDYLKEIHPSWLATLLRMFSKSEIALFLASLPTKQADELKKLLLYSNHLPHLTSPGRAFLQKTLLSKLKDEDILPIECLPKTPLDELLNLNYNQLRRLIQFLGLHDLAVEIKQIIETVRLKQIYSALDNDEQLYIKRLLQKKEAVVFKKMALTKWKGDKESLKNAIEKRGINRLAKALFGQHPSLIWHLKHRLDTDRAEQLQTLCEPLEYPDMTRILIEQTAFLISHLKKA